MQLSDHLGEFVVDYQYQFSKHFCHCKLNGNNIQKEKKWENSLCLKIFLQRPAKTIKRKKLRGLTSKIGNRVSTLTGNWSWKSHGM